MDIQDEIKKLYPDYEKSIRKSLDEDSRKKIRAILDILEIGVSSVAHTKLLLHICEDEIDKCSLSFGAKRDA